MDISTKLLIGTIVLAIAIYVIYNVTKKNKQIEEKGLETSEPIVASSEDTITEISMIEEEGAVDESDSETLNLTKKEKGDMYEVYVIERLGKITGNTFVDKTSDYYSPNVKAEANEDPDLKFRFGKTEYAVECKYRSSIGIVQWAKAEQIKRYKNYQNKNNIQVLVAVGLGGTPNNPKYFYIIPLDNLSNPTLTYDERKNYYIKGTNAFIPLKELLSLEEIK